MKIRNLQKEDWPAVAEIYQVGMDTGIATLETKVPDWETYDAKFLPAARFVAEDDNKILGWAVLYQASKRWVYRGVAEVSIYVDLECTQKGVGSVLMETLIKAAEEEGFWTLQSNIFAENVASIRLHEKLGFRIVGVRERIGERNGEWKDILLMERRSTLIG